MPGSILYFLNNNLIIGKVQLRENIFLATMIDHCTVCITYFIACIESRYEGDTSRKAVNKIYFSQLADQFKINNVIYFSDS